MTDNDFHPDGNIPFIPELVDTTANGVLEFHADGTFNYTPNENFYGVDTFTYRLSSTTLPKPLISTGDLWKYLDDGSDQGVGWVSPTFDDSGWEEGGSELGYGDGDEETVVSFRNSVRMFAK